MKNVKSIRFFAPAPAKRCVIWLHLLFGRVFQWISLFSQNYDKGHATFTHICQRNWYLHFTISLVGFVIFENQLYLTKLVARFQFLFILTILPLTNLLTGNDSHAVDLLASFSSWVTSAQEITKYCPIARVLSKNAWLRKMTILTILRVSYIHVHI